MSINQRPWKVEVVTPPANRPISAAEVNAHCNLDGVEADEYLELLIDAAVDYYQQATRSTLMQRTLLVTFYDGEPIDLPYGPLIEVQSVIDKNEEAINSWSIRHAGRVPRLLPATIGAGYPISVTYTAGHSDATMVPAAVRLGLLQLVASFNENREAITDRQKLPVPHAFEAFMRQRSRQIGIG